MKVVLHRLHATMRLLVCLVLLCALLPRSGASHSCESDYDHPHRTTQEHAIYDNAGDDDNEDDDEDEDEEDPDHVADGASTHDDIRALTPEMLQRATRRGQKDKGKGHAGGGSNPVAAETTLLCNDPDRIIQHAAADVVRQSESLARTRAEARFDALDAVSTVARGGGSGDVLSSLGEAGPGRLEMLRKLVGPLDVGGGRHMLS